ncbi:CHAT domain-containing protein [Phormidesmis sp. 146-33]
MTQEFYISVTPVGEDGYLIRTERVATGVPLAEELVTWKVEDWLTQAGQLMHDPLLGLLRGNLISLGQRTRSGSENGATLSSSLVEFGQNLYNSLFQGTIRDSWVIAQGIAHNHREDLRLRLGLKGDLLPRLPWEVLHAGNRPLSTGTDVIFSRYQASASMATVLHSPRPLRTPTHSPDQSQTLRILMVLAAPTDQEVLALKEEAHHLNQELQKEAQDTLSGIELTILEQPGREQLTQAIEQGRYQVLHYAGHSNLGASGGDLYLVSDRTGLTEVLSGDDLAGLLVNNGIHMAVFNSCRGVYTATSDPNREADAGNLTEALLKRGVPAVLAMAERIPDDVALTLSRLFYRNLKQRSPIDLSLSRARQGLLSSYGSNQLYWALPILYLHPDFDGYLQPPINEWDEAETEDFIGEIDLNDPDYPDDQKAVEDMFGELIRPSEAPAQNPFQPGEDLFPDEQASSNSAPSHSTEDLITLGQVLYEQGDTAAAIATFGDALAVDPNSAPAYYYLGIALEDYGRTTQAIVAYEMAVELDSTLESARHNLQRLQVAHNLPGQNSVSSSNAQPTNLIESSNPPQPSNLVQSGVSGGSEMTIASTDSLTQSTPVDRIFARPQEAPSRQKSWGFKRSWAIVGVTSVVILGVGIWGASRFLPKNPRPNEMLPQLEALTQNPKTPANSANPSRDETNDATALAIKNFSQGNLRLGQEGVEALLDRGAITAAETAFASVPPNQLDTPAISFLRGRIAWQSIARGNRNYDPGDPRRYWETATKGKADPLYFNALGFSYYAEGNLQRATDAWFQSLKLSEEQKKNGAPSQDMLTAYAGLALASLKSSPSQPPAQKARLRGEAVKLRDRVNKAAPDKFLPGTLSRNWLWTEAAIADWRSLQAIK